MNIPQSTSNIQHPTAPCQACIGSSTLNVRRWMFLLFLCCITVTADTQPGSTDTNTLKLLPPHGELPPTFWEQYGTLLLASGFVLLLLAAIAAWLILRPKPKPIVPPQTQARRALEALRRREEDGQCLSEISQILRNYFVAAFQLSGGELTTTEFRRAISENEKIGEDLAASVVEFLRECDERKFSPAKSSVPMGAVDRGLKFIESAEARRGPKQTA